MEFSISQLRRHFSKAFRENQLHFELPLPPPELRLQVLLALALWACVVMLLAAAPHLALLYRFAAQALLRNMDLRS